MSQTFLEYYSVVTTALIVVAPVVGYRFAGPRLSVRASVASVQGVNRLFVEINNNGRSAITVDIAGVRTFYFFGSRPKEQFTRIRIIQGPELPVRLEGNSFSGWEVSTDFLPPGFFAEPTDYLWIVLKLGGRRRKRRFRVRVSVDRHGGSGTLPDN